MDQFVPGGEVPSCQLSMKWTGEQEQPMRMVHRVELLGAKQPINSFVISPPQLVPFEGSSELLKEHPSAKECLLSHPNFYLCQVN